jgi:hypothetical protein
MSPKKDIPTEPIGEPLTDMEVEDEKEEEEEQE